MPSLVDIIRQRKKLNLLSATDQDAFYRALKEKRVKDKKVRKKKGKMKIRSKLKLPFFN